MQPMDGALIVIVSICAFTDVLFSRIYNWATYGTIVLAFVAAAAGHGAHTLCATPVTLFDSLTGFLVGFAPFLLLYTVGGVGGGDVKLLAAIGAAKGPTFVAYTMLYSLFAGALAGLVVAGVRGELRPILRRVGYTILHSVTPGMGPTSHLDPKGPRISFGPAVLVGTLLCLLGQSVGRQLMDF